MYRIVPDADVVLVRRTFLEPAQILPFLLPPLVGLVVDHLQTYRSDVEWRESTLTARLSDRCFTISQFFYGDRFSLLNSIAIVLITGEII